MSTTPPVINSRPGQGRTDDRQTVAPPSDPTRAGPAGPWRPTSAAPPVLNSPARTAARHDPPAPARPGRGRADGPGTARPPRPGTEWVGSDTARADATAPVLDAPDVPPSGAAVSKLEEVPSRLRGKPGTPAQKGRRTGTPAPELSARRTKPPAAERPQRERAEEQPSRIVTDEEAFGVETPGGGVLAKQPEDRSYRPEPPPTIAGS